MTGSYPAQSAFSAERLLKEIRQLPRVYGLDRFGTVHLAPNAVYRVTQPAGEPVLKYIVAQGILEQLVKSGLVETQVRYASPAPAQLPSILEHRRIRFVTSPPEWSPTMLLEAARLLCTFSLDLDDHGLMLQDGHALNVTFERGRPAFLDFGSIMFSAPAAQANWLEEFRSRVLAPVWLAGLGQRELVRQMMKTEPRGLSWYLARTRLGRRLPFGFGRVVRMRRRGWRPALVALLEMLDRIQIPVAPAERPAESAQLHEARQRTQAVVLDHLRRRRPESVHHVNGGTAGIAEAIASCLQIPTCSTDGRGDRIERAHQRTKTLNLPMDLAVLDILFPTSPYGAGASRPGAVERLRADTALALSMFHRFVIRNQITVDTFAQIVGDYGARAAIVEFTDPGDEQIQRWQAHGFSIPPDYQWDSFVGAFLQHYGSYEVLPTPYENRRLVEFSR